MGDLRAEPLDRLLNGELSAADQRDLAQAALDDDALFEELTAAGVVDAALARDRHRVPHSAHNSALRADGRGGLRRIVAIAALASAAAVVFAIAYNRSTSRTAPPAQTGAIPDSPSPVVIAQPLLLTARLERVSEGTFRTDETPTRPPRQTGTIVAVHDGEIDLDLGSLDGLKQGARVRAIRGGNNAADVDRVTITTVFRERSRGRTGRAGEARVGDRIEVAPAVYVMAMLEQVAARRSVQDVAGARALAEIAASRAQAADVPSDVRRRALDQLGTLTRQTGELIESARLLNAVAAEFDIAPVASPAERADVLNELGVIQINQRDYAAAGRTLQSADSYAAGAMKVRVMNNLGALAALRGDRAAAESLYQRARSLAGDSPELAADRQAIEKNLDGLAAAHRAG